MLKGWRTRAETYSLNGSLVGNAWRLEFRDGDKSGTLSLPLAPKVLTYMADIRDGQTSGGGGPLLYKEWRFEGQVRGWAFSATASSPPPNTFSCFRAGAMGARAPKISGIGA